MSDRGSPSERRAAGEVLRKQVPRSSHGDWTPEPDRPDPVAFFRGAAKIMAGDLSSTPSSGLDAQLCGDAHLANLGTYASPDRHQVFDVNVFDKAMRNPAFKYAHQNDEDYQAFLDAIQSGAIEAESA